MSFRKLNPRVDGEEPGHVRGADRQRPHDVAFVSDLAQGQTSEALFSGQISLWLWFTVLFANFAEAMAEGRGKAQAETLRKARTETKARQKLPDGTIEEVVSSALREGRYRGREGGTGHSGGWHRHRRGGFGRRVGDYRRVGARHPGIRRRPQRRYRGYDGAFGSYLYPDHDESRRVFPGSDDCAGGGGGSAKNAE